MVAIGRLHGIDRRDVWVAEMSKYASLTLKASTSIPIVYTAGREQLERDASTETGIVSKIHDPHSAPSDFSDNGVSPDSLFGRSPRLRLENPRCLLCHRDQ
jgi:hypothetical protein